MRYKFPADVFGSTIDAKVMVWARETEDALTDFAWNGEKTWW